MLYVFALTRAPVTGARRRRAAVTRVAGAARCALGAASPRRPPALASARVLRVCADPNNLPFSNARGEGFENRIAELVARDIGRARAVHLVGRSAAASSATRSTPASATS